MSLVGSIQNYTDLPAIREKQPIAQIKREQLKSSSSGCFAGLIAFVLHCLACFYCWRNRGTDFTTACESGNLDLVQAHLIRGGVDVVTLSNGLREAYNAGKDAVFLTLMSAGVSIARPGGRTMLHDALESGREDLACKMIAAGAKVDAALLQIACEQGLDKAAKAMIEAGAPAKDVFLLLAAAHHEEGIRVLSGAGFDVAGTRFACQNTALHQACMANLTEFVQHVCLFSHYGTYDKSLIDAVNTLNHTALYYALKPDRKEISLALLNAGATNALVKEGSLLLLAMERGVDRAVIEKLVQTKQNLDVLNPQGLSALHVAIQKGDVELVQLLVGCGATLNLKTTDGRTPLSLALDNPVMLGYLASRCAVQGAAAELNLAFQQALQSANAPAVKTLFAAGAAIDQVDAQGNTLLHQMVGKPALLAALLSARKIDINAKNKKGETALHFAAKIGAKASVRILLEGGAKAGIQDLLFQTPLHYAARKEQLEIADQLLSRMSVGEINLKDVRGNSALHYAAFVKRMPLVQAVIEKGANVNATNMKGHTPLHLACGTVSEKFERPLIVYLLQHGADKTVPDARGNVPYRYIPKNDPAEILELFVTS